MKRGGQHIRIAATSTKQCEASCQGIETQETEEPKKRVLKELPVVQEAAPVSQEVGVESQESVVEDGLIVNEGSFGDESPLNTEDSIDAESSLDAEGSLAGEGSLANEGVLASDGALNEGGSLAAEEGLNNGNSTAAGSTVQNELEPGVETTKPVEVAIEGEQGDGVFDDELIDWSWLDGLALDFNLNAERVVVDDIEMNELTLPISISNGVLTVADFNASVADGTFTSSFVLTKKESSAEIEVNMNGAAIVLEKLNFLPPEELQKAVTDIALNLTTKGETSRQLASALNGSVEVVVGDGVIGNDSFELIGSDLILSLLNKLNPFSKSDKTTKLECAIVNLNIEDGKIDIDKSLALKTSKLTMVANGYVDLTSEKIKLSLTPKARSGVGVDVSSLVKFIALGGTLTSPAPVVTASGVLKSAVVVGAAVSTGGISLLATSAAEKAATSVDVCERARTAFQ